MALYLSGVPIDYVKARLAAAGGNEMESGKLDSAESSAALAVNCFAWFHQRPALLPPFPNLGAGYPCERVEVEFEARFPWSGGRHPWLDAYVVTASRILGVESKRFEPFRDAKKIDFSDAYSRPVWGHEMGPFESLRDALKDGQLSYVHLDAAQLVKHAFGLATQGARQGKAASLVYLFAEPPVLSGRAILQADFDKHRAEIADFGERVAGTAVEFSSCSYREWLSGWPTEAGQLSDHANALLEIFNP